MNETNSRPAEKVCDVDGCNAWKEGDYRYCYHHKGLEQTTGAPENNNNAVTHGLHQSKETFLEHAKDHHKDLFHAMHESLCSDYELKHGRLPEHIEKKLADIALDMVRIDMGDEYEADNAVDPEKPLTELEKQMSESGPWEKEVTSKIETVKTNISRETRLALKDMGIYNSPEKQQADAMERTLAEILSE
jgi:hypothetical protein